MTAPPSTSTVLRDLGRYQVHAALAAGGMATVHVARQQGAAGFARTVAIKRLHEQYAFDQTFVAMMVDEARLASRIRHPNVVPTLDVVARQDGLFIVMEFIHGLSLARLLVGVEVERATVPLPIASAIVCQALRGLHAAHEAKDDFGAPLQIVHRDVSPQNIMVGADGITRMVDFGVAKAAARLQQTDDGQLKGKLGYMSPEQVHLRPIDRRTDLFAMGIVLWEVLAQRRLISAPDPAGKIAQIANLEVPSLRELRGTGAQGDEVPPALEAVIARALAREPEARFETAEEMARALEASVPCASASGVSDWVHQFGAEELARIERLVRKMEASNPGDYSAPIEYRPDPPSGVDSRPPPGPRKTAGHGEQSTIVERVPASPQVDGTLTTTTTTTTQRRDANAATAEKNRRAAAVSVGIVILAGASWFAWSHHQPSTPEPKSAMQEEKAAPTLPPTSAAEPRAPEAASADKKEEAAPVATGTPLTSSGPPTNNPATRRNVRAQAKPSSAKLSCSPPYVIVDGMKKYKPECL